MENQKEYDVVRLAAEILAEKLFESQTVYSTNLDNCISECEREDSMKKIRRRYIVNGKQTWVSGNTQQQIFEAIKNLILEDKKPSDCPYFQDYARNWFKTFKLFSLKPNTAVGYNTDLQKHIIPYFKNKRLNEITTEDIQNFYNQKMDYAKSTVHCMTIILHQIFQSALQDELIQKDPTHSSRLYFSNKKQVRMPIDNQRSDLIINKLNLLKQNDRVLIALFLFTGMRRGEALALRWEDLDFENNIINVRRAVMFRHNRGVISTTKSQAGVRSIPMIENMRNILIELQQSGTYITTGTDEPMSQTCFKRTWQRIQKILDIKDITPHMLRHTFATMAASIIDVKTLQSIMGHADITTTMNRYVHSRQDKIKQSSSQLNCMFSK